MKKSKKVLLIISILLVAGLAGTGIRNAWKESRKQVVTVSAAYAYRTLTELTEASSIVIKGTVIGQSQPFKIKPASGADESIFTDYTIQIDTLYRGTHAGNIAYLRMQGGEIENLSVYAEDAPEIKTGESYMLFLYKPFTGGTYTTKGDYYYLTQGPQALFFPLSVNVLQRSMQAGNIPLAHLDRVPKIATFNSSSDKIFMNAEVSAIEENGRALSPALITENGILVVTENNFSQEIRSFNKTVPLDPDYSKKEMIDSLKSNLENGFLTQQEYDEAMKFNFPYAEIVE